MWGSVLDDLRAYRSRNSTLPMPHNEPPASPPLRESLSRRFSFVRRGSHRRNATPSMIFTPPAPINEHIDDPLAAAGAALPSPPLSPSAFASGAHDSQAADVSHLNSASAAHLNARGPLNRPVSFALDAHQPAASPGSSSATTPGSVRPALERRPSRRERLVAGLNRSMSWRSAQSGGDSSSSSGGLNRGLGSIRRTLSRTYSSPPVRMPTEAEVEALEEHRERQKYDYDVVYDYMGSMAYCDGAYFNEDLEYS